MKLRCLKQDSGDIGLDGRYYPVKGGTVDVPDDVGARLVLVAPDEFQPAATGKKGEE